MPSSYGGFTLAMFVFRKWVLTDLKNYVESVFVLEKWPFRMAQGIAKPVHPMDPLPALEAILNNPWDTQKPTARTQTLANWIPRTHVGVCCCTQEFNPFTSYLINIHYTYLIHRWYIFHSQLTKILTFFVHRWKEINYCNLYLFIDWALRNV